jgi:hypothetical protein
MDSKVTVAGPAPAIANAPLAPVPLEAQPPSAQAASSAAAIAARASVRLDQPDFVDASLIEPAIALMPVNV